MNDTVRANKVRVVVADDQRYERTGISLILDSDDGIEVVGEAASGEEAVAVVAQQVPDVVLMDVRMPGMGGIAATAIITERHPETRVIVFTTFDLDDYAFGGLRAGASAFLLKSATPEALVEAVRTVAAGAAVVEPRVTSRLIEHYLRSGDSPATGMPQGKAGAWAGGGAGDSPADGARAAKRAGAAGLDGAGAAAEARLSVLSQRERVVFAGMVRGLTNAEIAAELHLAQSTVKSYINSIFAKLGLRDRVHAVILGYELGQPRGRSASAITAQHDTQSRAGPQ